MSSSIPTIRELFEAAIALDAPARAEFLEQHCPDPERRAQVEALIAADEDAGEPLQTGAIDRMASAMGPTRLRPSLPAGSRVGPFELQEVIGEGGSSTVFHAVREVEGVTQHVALKLMRCSLYSPDAQRAFRREQHALIQLRHPNIARMIEGGVNESGLPYIALELVVGSTITDYVRTHQLGLRRRLHLFSVVCLAVEAAHRALIVHRDLKPSNVLVTEDGEVKLLDFGIAKLLAEDGEGSHTQMPAFTPAYAAPEQQSGGPTTTATDVYALGVLLGEIVTGERVNDGSGRTPSSRISAPSGSARPVALHHVTRKQVRGDLDAIILKALEADPLRRYASAGRLAEDIERLLCSQPVSAQPPSRWYRAHKFMLRHKGGVATTVAFLLAILAALGLALWQARLAREQTVLAEQASSRAETTLAFIVNVLQTASADLPKDQRPTPEALVREAAKNARDDPELDPLVRAQLFTTLAEIARSNGENRQAELLIDEAIEGLHEQGSSPSSPEWIAALVSKGNLLHDTDRTAEADQLMLGLLPALEGVDTEGAVSALMLYSATRAYAEDTDRAVEFGTRALQKAQRVFGVDSLNAVYTAMYVGLLANKLKHYVEGESILSDVVARWRRLGLPRNEVLARCLFHLAKARHKIGKAAGVETLYREGIALMRSVGDESFYKISMGLRGLADFQIDMEKFAEAKAVLDEAGKISGKVGEDSSEVALTRLLQARWHEERNEWAEAERTYRSAHAALAKNADQGATDAEFSRVKLDWSRALIELGRLDEAATLLAQSKIALGESSGSNDIASPDFHCISGELDMANNRFESAVANLDRGLDLFAKLDVAVPSSEVRCRRSRVNALLALNRAHDARLEAAKAFTRQQEASPQAKGKLAGLLALRARAEQADADPSAAAASIEQARLLAAPVELLSTADRTTLEL